MKKLVIAEKPSVGREIARNLGCFSKEKGYTEGPEYIVTWALGHLVELADPQHFFVRDEPKHGFAGKPGSCFEENTRRSLGNTVFEAMRDTERA